VAYVNGSTVTINAIEAPNKAPQRAQADFYQLVYPIGWQALGLAAPQCNPCDHTGNGIDFTDFHDYVLDSIPSDLGHGEFSPLRHVFLILPDFTGDAAHDAAVSAAYAQALSTTSDGSRGGYPPLFPVRRRQRQRRTLTVREPLLRRGSAPNVRARAFDNALRALACLLPNCGLCSGGVGKDIYT
jgi:hypothetical protein